MDNVGRMKIGQCLQGIQANHSNLLLCKRSSAQFDEISDRTYRTVFHQYLEVIVASISTGRGKKTTKCGYPNDRRLFICDCSIIGDDVWMAYRPEDFDLLTYGLVVITIKIEYLNYNSVPR